MKKLINYVVVLIKSICSKFINLFKKKKMSGNIITDFSLFNIINKCIENNGVLQIKAKGSDFWYDVITPSFVDGVHFIVKNTNTKR